MCSSGFRFKSHAEKCNKCGSSDRQQLQPASGCLGSLVALDLMYRSITYGTDRANAVSMETTVAWGHRHKTGSQMWDSSAFTSRQTRSALRRGSRAIPLAREHHKEEGGHTARSSKTPGNTRTTRRKFLSILQWTAESFEPSLPSQRARTFSLLRMIITFSWENHLGDQESWGHVWVKAASKAQSLYSLWALRSLIPLNGWHRHISECFVSLTTESGHNTEPRSSVKEFSNYGTNRGTVASSEKKQKKRD